MTLSAWSLLPPLAAIALALGTRQVMVSLGAGVVLAGMVQAGGHPGRGLAAGLDGVVNVFSDPGQTRLVLFALLIGPLVRLMEVSGGVAGLIAWLESRRLVTSARGARLLALAIGVALFIETNITILVSGAICRPLFDRHHESRQRLAYLADSTSAPICILIPFNAWGALILALLAAQGVAEPLKVFAAAVPLNFYALAAVTLAALTAWTGWAPGPMARAQRQASSRLKGEVGSLQERETPVHPSPAPGRMVNMVLPLMVLLTAMPTGLWITGGGVLSEGSGSTSALWAVLLGVATAATLMLLQRTHTLDQVMKETVRGMESLLGLVLILVLAMALGQLCATLGTGVYVAESMSRLASPALVLPVTFLGSALVAFATGTSWGTFAVMMPIAVSTATTLDIGLAALVAAVLSGGIFGDHASPISDTTVVASLAAGTDVVEHVRTQMPYALLAGAMALAGFAVAGAFMAG